MSERGAKRVKLENGVAVTVPGVKAAADLRSGQPGLVTAEARGKTEPRPSARVKAEPGVRAEPGTTATDTHTPEAAEVKLEQQSTDEEELPVPNYVPVVSLHTCTKHTRLPCVPCICLLIPADTAYGVQQGGDEINVDARPFEALVSIGEEVDQVRPLHEIQQANIRPLHSFVCCWRIRLREHIAMHCTLPAVWLLPRCSAAAQQHTSMQAW